MKTLSSSSQWILSFFYHYTQSTLSAHNFIPHLRRPDKNKRPLFSFNSNDTPVRAGIMVNSLTVTPAAATPISTKSKKATSHAPPLGFQRVRACHGEYMPFSDGKLVHRRTATIGLAGVVMGFNIGGSSASAAARRPPPPPPEEKKDPNVSGVQAKVLASKKRKEAMKESMAKLREKGKPINGPSE